MIMCVLCYPVSFHMLQLLLTGCPISSSMIRDGLPISMLAMVSYIVSFMRIPKSPMPLARVSCPKLQSMVYVAVSIINAQKVIISVKV